MYKSATKTDLRNILVVRLGAMGDIVHTLPAVASLKVSFPRSRVTWIVEPKWLPLLEGNPFVDRTIAFNRRSLTSIREAWRLLRMEPVDLAIDFQGLIKSALVAMAGHPEQLFGYHRSQARESLAAWLYSHQVITHSIHIVDMHLELARAAGAKNTITEFPLPEGTPEGVLPELPYVLANPLAGWQAKQWPLEYYGELAALAKSELGLELVLNGPPGSSLSAVKGAHVHDSTLKGLIWATRHATAVVGLDSGPLHLAAALNKPGVAIFGPTDPARNGPYGSSFRVLRSPEAMTSYKRRPEVDPSMRQISPRQVADALKSVLEPVKRT
jgi:heptosyltransferase-1